jgi:hypothetical protein
MRSVPTAYVNLLLSDNSYDKLLTVLAGIRSRDLI